MIEVNDPLRDARRQAFAEQSFMETLTDQLLTSDADGTPEGVSAGPSVEALHLHLERLVHDLAAAGDPRRSAGVLSDWLENYLNGDLAMYSNLVGSALVDLVEKTRSLLCTDAVAHGEALWKARVMPDGSVQYPTE